MYYATMNLATFIEEVITFFPNLDGIHIAGLVLQLNKEIVFLFTEAYAYLAVCLFESDFI
jgi:hypothetical protein